MSSPSSHPHALRRSALAIALRGILGSAACLPVMAGMAFAEQTQTRHYDLPAGALEDSLNTIAQLAGITLPFDPALVQGKRAPALKGSFAIKDGLDALLAGSGLMVLVSPNGNWMMYPTGDQGGALEVGATVIEGQGMGQMTENSGSYTPTRISAGSKTPVSLRQTPQTVSVITQQVVEDQKLVDLTDALKITPGITVKNTNERIYEYTSRGFVIENIQIDGAAPMSLGTTAGSFYSSKEYNLAEFDHVEVLRGSSGLFGGTGDPGGIINLVRKRPLDTYQLKVEASAGSWDNYRTQLDVTGPLAFDGKLRGRLVTAYNDRQYFIDGRSSSLPSVYGILEADILPQTRLTVGGRYDRISQNGASAGLPRYSTGEDLKLSRSTNLTDSWAYQDGRSQELFAKIDHEFSDAWKVNLTYTRTQDAGLQKRAFNVGGLNPITGEGPTRFGSVARYRSDQQLLDLNLSGKFDMLGREQELLLGADYQRITSRWRGTSQLAGAFGAIDVFDPESTPWPNPPTDKHWIRDYSPNDQTQYGLYSTLRLHLADPLHLIVGARAHRYKFNQEYRELDGGSWVTQSNIPLREPTKVVPYGGVVYDLSDDWSAFASYSEIYKPQQDKLAGPPPGSSVVEAMTGKTYETGIKGELWGGAVNTSISLYYTQRENEALEDPSYPFEAALFSGSCCYLAQGKVVSKGVDLELSGEILPDWSVLAGYTYNHNQRRDDDSPFNSVTPKHLFKLFSTYRLPGVLDDLKVGGGVTLQSANYVSGRVPVLDGVGKPVVVNGEQVSVPYQYSQAGYAVWNALAEYRLDEHWTVAYNLNNAFDKRYYNTVGSSAVGNYYGEPRNHMLTLRGTFW
ncbi:TonB-dependent siderophore receptor [Pseudomonas huaxiensis]|uniref:TonB-dependent siderophore receptor n=1 Tax=Pseudomonas huaxiensis TaxID=2213017 RepID=UPI001CDCA6F2|nr:TonB-dependent siderophore receptor [Pseudomonas huaxiensis]